VVNSASSPSFDWNESENPPGTAAVLVKTAGVPVDRYAEESIELLRDIAARWVAQRAAAAAAAPGRDPAAAPAVNVINADIYPIEVSFQMLADESERDYLNQLPTSFALPAEAVDRLRAAAKQIILSSPDFQQLMKASPEPAGASAGKP
jgi:NTE family protein